MADTPCVVQLVPADSLGGVETAARLMAAEQFDAIRFRLLFLTGATLAPASAQIIESIGWGYNNPFSYLRAVRTLLALKPDIVIASLWRSVPVAVLAKLLRPSLRLVGFLHNTRDEHRLDAVATRVLMRCADEIWADAQASIDQRARRYQNKARVISFVTERRDPLERTGFAPRFVSWGRLHRQKGHDHAIRLIALLHQRGVPAQLDIYGPDNGEGEALHMQVKVAGLSDFIHFRGRIVRESIPDIAAPASFYLQLSRYEGMAMAVVEAMQLGLIPVTTAVGQMAHYVRDGENGLHVGCDALDVAADRLASLFNDQAEMHALSRAAIATWRDAPLYHDDMQAAALALMRKTG